jgi:hypothetical protein
MFNILPFEVKIKIFYDYFSFYELLKLRLVNKEFINIINNEKFWEIINLTDINTNSKTDILKSYSNSKESHIYCLNKNITTNAVISIPNSIKQKIIYTKLLII